MVVAATLVTVTTLLLGAFGLMRYLSDRDEKYGRLARVNAVEADVLSDSLALPIWNIDRAQIDKIIEGMGATPSVQAVVVQAAGKTQARVRMGPWLMPSDGKFPTAGLLVEERPIVFSNQRIGTVWIYATPRYIQSELRQSLLSMVAAIVVLDMMLVLSVYLILWRTVLWPLVAIEKYAVAVSEGKEPEAVAVRSSFAEELEALRSSIETMVRLLDQRYAQLLGSEERFRTIFDSANDAIFLTDPVSGRIADVNSRSTDMFGYTRQEALNMEIVQLSSGVEPYTQSGALAVIAKALAGEPQMFEWHARHRDGHLFWIEGSTRVANIEGRQRMIVVVRDITQRKEMESALKSEKEFTDTAINAMMGIFWVRDAYGRYVRWNKEVERVLGAKGEDLSSLDGLDVVHPDDRNFAARKRAEVFERGYAEWETRLVLPATSEVRHYLLTGRRMDVGDEAFLVGTGVDVTERRQAEAERERLLKALEQSALEWRQTFDSVQTPIIVTDQSGVVRRLNDAASELAERPVAEVPGMPLAAIGEQPWRAAADLISSFDGLQAGAEVRDAHGRTWEVSISRLFAEGSDESLIVVFWDITGIVRMQEWLRRSERMSAMGSLVAGVAHEVRNPLFGMSALLDAYAEELQSSDLEQFSAGLRDQVTRLSQLMHDLLEFGKPVAVALFPGSLHDVAEEALAGRARAAAEVQVTLRNTIDPRLTAVAMDHGRLRQVFENLIDNALQHAPPVRTVTIAAREIAYSGARSVECTVQDDGAGFQAGDLPHVFEPFFTRRERGTGLGLSIVQRIVEEHSGRAMAGNAAAGGAVITMRFPPAGMQDAATALIPPGREAGL